MGQSDGGNVGLLLARYHPELVRRLVVSGASIRGDHDGVEAYERSRQRSPEQLAANLPQWFHDDYVGVSPAGEQHWLTAVAKSKELWLTRVVLEQRELGAIQAPVLVMAGGHDIVPLEHTIEIFRGLRKGQPCILPATGHGTELERPEDFNRMTRAFPEQTATP